MTTPDSSAQPTRPLLSQQINGELPNSSIINCQALLPCSDCYNDNLAEIALKIHGLLSQPGPSSPPAIAPALMPPFQYQYPRYQHPQCYQLYTLQAAASKDLRDWIKYAEVPKYDSINNKDAVLDFTKYCWFIRISISSPHSVSLWAGRWWEYAEKARRPGKAKKAFLRKYGNIFKRDECIEKLTDLYQGSMSIADFFTICTARSGKLPRLLKRRLNSDLRHALEISHGIQPITTYEEWKHRTLRLGTQLEAGEKQGNHGPKKSSIPIPLKPKATTVPKEERSRRMKGLKCGKSGHIARECRTGYVHSPEGPTV